MVRASDGQCQSRNLRDLSLAGRAQNFFFLSVHCFSYLVLIAQKTGQAVVPDRLSLKVGLWSQRFWVQSDTVESEGRQMKYSVDYST
jgi:hypothetical protein